MDRLNQQLDALISGAFDQDDLDLALAAHAAKYSRTPEPMRSPSPRRYKDWATSGQSSDEVMLALICGAPFDEEIPSE